MTNRRRGEISATLDGIEYRLVLTLGALASLEDAFGADDLFALAERFDSGRLKAWDCTRIIGAGLRGAGYALRDEDVANMQADKGAAGFVAIVADLLTATFASAQQEDAGGTRNAPGPFPGPT